MRRTLPLVAVLLAAPAHAGDDPWWGPDKALHLGVSAGVSLGAGWLLHQAKVPAPLELPLAFGATVLLGAAKEAADALGLGTPSWRDFTWDVVGALCGALLTLAAEAVERWLWPAPALQLAPGGRW